MKHKMTKNGWVYRPHRATTATASGALAVTGQAVFYGVSVKTDGSNDVTLSVFDSLVASGTALIEEDIVIDGGAGYAAIEETAGLPVDNGIYVVVTCAGTCSYKVYYDND